MASFRQVCIQRNSQEIYTSEFLPDTNQIVLPYWLSKAALYKIYKEEAPTVHLSESSFYSNFKLQFGSKRLDKGIVGPQQIHFIIVFDYKKVNY